MELNSNIFNDLKNLPKQGIYMLKNDNNIFISYSMDIPSALVRSINIMREKMEFNVLEIISDKKNLRIRSQYYKDKYKEQGYNIINTERKAANRKISIKLLPDFRTHITGMCLFYVKIVSKGYGELVVGVFKHSSEVDSFMSQNYNNGINNIIYADNDLTKEYLNVRS